MYILRAMFVFHKSTKSYKYVYFSYSLMKHLLEES